MNTNFLTSDALAYITHLVLHYTGTSGRTPNGYNNDLFHSSSHTTALSNALISLATLVPNLQYLAVNFYRHLLPAILASTDATEKDNFQDLLFLSTAMGKIVDMGCSIKLFAIWVDGTPRAELNFDKAPATIKKCLPRDLRSAFKKIE
jgi:hypothetical protein